eukprot:g43210.t1
MHVDVGCKQLLPTKHTLRCSGPASTMEVIQSKLQAESARYPILYIGETKQRLGDRFAERSVRTKQLHLPVVNHFNCSSHSSDDMSILGLLQCHNDAT